MASAKHILKHAKTKQWDTSLAEAKRLIHDDQRKENWSRWGPYLSERQWGTVREDYSADGSAWDYLTHDQARSRAYRWGEDGLLGITDRQCRLCFCLGLWNGKDPIIKERLYGLTGSEGNHGEDCKECYYYLDAVPSNAYLKGLYKYPHAEYPYAELKRVNAERSRDEDEYELEDTGVFDNDNYFDVTAEYFKNTPNDIGIKITVTNRGVDTASIHVLPQLWLRNTWVWGFDDEAGTTPGNIEVLPTAHSGSHFICATQETLGSFILQTETAEGEVWFTNNETNYEACFGSENPQPYTKDAFHRRLINGEKGATNPERKGTKCCVHYEFKDVAPGQSKVIRLRLYEAPLEKRRRSFGFGLGKASKASAAEDKGRMEADDAQVPDGPSVDHEQARHSIASLHGDAADKAEESSSEPRHASVDVIHGRSKSVTKRHEELSSKIRAAALAAVACLSEEQGKSSQSHEPQQPFTGSCSNVDLHNLEAFDARFEELLRARIQEADEFYASRVHASNAEHLLIQRQAFAGLLWSKQFYFYVVKQWLDGDTKQPTPPESRKHGRNRDWPHLYNRDIISMPDKWEYPWYATWDLAFHMVPMAVIDPFFAKKQLRLFLREWYMHPNGAMPAYEWAFDDVNPPVHAWAVWRVYKLSAPRGKRDVEFLEQCFHKLLMNFTWWVNRKDPQGEHVFSGGFLGLDNIGLFDRSKPLEHGGHLVQADGTSWMAFFSVTMLDIALELASHNSAYESIASKFFEHFVQISNALNTLQGTGLWNEEDGFYYDHLRYPDGTTQVLKVRSMVGLIPLYACLTLEDELLQRLPNFKRRLKWFLQHMPHLATQIQIVGQSLEHQKRHLLAIPSREQLEAVLAVLFDEKEFFAPHGIRSLSKVYETPYTTTAAGEEVSVEYTPAESRTAMFGGNSNWRGPIWFPVNYLIIESLERYYYYYGDDLQVEVPTGSGNMMNLHQAAGEIAKRLGKLFEKDPSRDRRPCNGEADIYSKDKDLVLFYEYFHPETGKGVGASHQTGWTSLITRCLARIDTTSGLSKQCSLSALM
eukprot:m.56755 g.56755  ORF g.56755 m.56755 type:complete len:1044 (+) comp11577_c0_seq1:227-3358(+)